MWSPCTIGRETEKHEHMKGDRKKRMRQGNVWQDFVEHQTNAVKETLTENMFLLQYLQRQDRFPFLLPHRWFVCFGQFTAYLFRPKLMSDHFKCSPDPRPTVTSRWADGLSTAESDSRAEAGGGAKVCLRLIRKTGTEVERGRQTQKKRDEEDKHSLRTLLSLLLSSSAEKKWSAAVVELFLVCLVWSFFFLFS